MKIKIYSVLLAFLLLLSTAGVSAIWTYYKEAESVEATLHPQLIEWEGSGDIDHVDKSIIDAFIREINNPDSPIHDYIKSRAGQGSWLAVRRNELGTMDPEFAEGLRHILDMDEYPDETLVIKLLYSGSSKTVIGYETYATEMDLSTLPEEDFASEVYTVSPVVRTLYTKDSNGKWAAANSQIGESRAIYYYEGNSWGGQHTNKVRSFDVTLWRAFE